LDAEYIIGVEPSMAVHRVVVDPERPDPAALDVAVGAIRGGGVVALPTDTMYGLAADPFRADAVTRVFAVKERPDDRALPLIAADMKQVRDRLGALPPLAERLAVRFWPGPLTLLVPASPALDTRVMAGTGKVGIRVPAHDTARMLCRACGIPLTATSANISGAPASADADEIARLLGDRIDVLIDAGPTPGGPPSTIVDASGDGLVLVRAGAISWDDIHACLDA
jgi:L-threonylcarbamoyladenylate synthase